MTNSLVRVCVIALSWVLASTSVALAGNESSGGADRKRLDYQSAWFAFDANKGPEPTISSCYKIADDFGVAETTVHATILSVFETWHAYIWNLKTYGQAFGPPDRYDIKPVSRLELHASCRGDESLIFYFGVSNEDIEKAKSEFDDPMAFAHRAEYQRDKGIGKGFIWIGHATLKNGWSNGKALYGILLHEVGHVLGCGEVEGTIMDSNIARDIRSEWKGYHDNDFHIDGSRFLVSPIYYVAKTPGKLGDVYSANRSTAETFKLFTGRLPVGEVSAFFSNYTWPYEFILQDQAGTHHIPFVEKHGVSAIFGGEAVAFKTVLEWIDPKNGPTIWAQGIKAALSAFMVGSIRDFQGVSHDATIRINDTNLGAAIRADYIDSGGSYIFMANPSPPPIPNCDNGNCGSSPATEIGTPR